MTAKKSKQPGPRWREFMLAAAKRVNQRGLLTEGKGGAKIHDYEIVVAREIVDSGEGEKFLMAARRGRPTQRQNLRYRLLREVERQMDHAKERRRPDANTPDSVALKKTVRLELEAYSSGGMTG